MEIIRGYEEMLEMAVIVSHPIEKVIGRLVSKGIILPEVAQRFLLEVR